MASIGEITQAASYRGDQNLGGGLAVGVTLDTSPLQRLATFTFYKDRDMWEKKNADNKLAADKIATIAAFDISSPLKPYTEDLKKGLNELKTFIRENPNALQFDKDPKLYQELVDRYGALQIKRKNATANDTLYNAAKAKIELIPNKADRDAQLELLELNTKDLFSGGIDDAYNKQLMASPELKQQDYNIPVVAMTEDFTITRLPNDTEITGVKFADIPRLKAQARAVYFGLGKELNEDDPTFKNLSEDGKKRARIENSVTARTRTSLDSVAASVNGMVQQFKATQGDPNLKVTDIPEQTISGNPTIGGVITLSKEYNNTIDKINAKTGQTNLHINLDDGVTGEELIELQTFGANKETFFTELKPTVQQTDNAIQLRGQNLDLLSDREGRGLQERLARAKDGGETTTSILEGNALNDIEIPQDTKPGIYIMSKGIGNKKNLGNIRKLLELKDSEGKPLPLLTDERLNSDTQEDKIKYEVEVVNGKPYVTSLIVDKVKYDRFHFRNSQLKFDTEAKGSEKTSYRRNQNYGESALERPKGSKNKIVVPGL